MLKLESGILDRTRLVSNLLMLILLIGNIFFTIQYTENIKAEAAKKDDTSAQVRYQTAHFLKSFIDQVINTKGVLTFDERVKLESDIRQIQDPALTSLWENFVSSKDAKAAQDNAVKLMSMLTNKLI
jgi:hypothetical protein